MSWRDPDLGSTRGHRPQPTAQATVLTAGKPDTGSISASQRGYGSSYFLHERTSLDLAQDFFEMKQNEITFIIKNPHAPQLPRFRTTLNGVDFSRETKDIIYFIEENLKSFDEKTRNELVREILSRRIFPVGVVKGDGFTYPAGKPGAMKVHDKFIVDSAGTVSMKVKGSNLGLGVPAEIKIPTRAEWSQSDQWRTGKISLFADIAENRTIYDRMSEIFWKFNIMEHPDLDELVRETIRDPKKRCDLPASIKLVSSFITLMKQISILTLQKGYAAGIFHISNMEEAEDISMNNPTTSASRDSVINKFLNRFGVDASETVNLIGIYNTIKSEDTNHSILKHSSRGASSSAESLKTGDKIFSSNKKPELFNPAEHFNFLAQSQYSSKYDTSLDILTMAFNLSDIINTDFSTFGSLRNKTKIDRTISEMSHDEMAAGSQKFFNMYNEMYHFLIHDFLPHAEASFFQLGNEELNEEPIVNTKIFEPIRFSDSQTSSQTHYHVNYQRDFSRSNQQIHEAFPLFLNKMIRWFKNMDHGKKIRVVEPANHSEAATIYVR